MFYVREDIPATLLSVETLPTGSIFVEINLWKKLLVFCSYNLHRGNTSNHLQTIKRNSYLHLSRYDNIIIVGDFNTEIVENSMNALCERYSLSSLIKESSCYKNL